ncbi:hypothetical protein [Frankia sp. AgB32]|uniref:hypothetical protein n=1 Tax=Frankia sp. AgB32 TaxID=631119 RepID=UPI002010B76D|nr:hypothetical protein [Frankia sp. AgB32]MCK9893595.1 hypothetical protein [Frankia sp. AgB32]
MAAGESFGPTFQRVWFRRPVEDLIEFGGQAELGNSDHRGMDGRQGSTGAHSPPVRIHQAFHHARDEMAFGWAWVRGVSPAAPTPGPGIWARRAVVSAQVRQAGTATLRRGSSYAEARNIAGTDMVRCGERSMMSFIADPDTVETESREIRVSPRCPRVTLDRG